MASTILKPTISNERILSNITVKKSSIPSIVDNSDSEFEMFHHRNKIMKNEKESRSKSADHDLSDSKSSSGNSSDNGSDFADNELAEFSKGESKENSKNSQSETESSKKCMNISTKHPSTSSSSSDDNLDKPSKHAFQSSELTRSPLKGSSESVRRPSKGSSESIRRLSKGSLESIRSPPKDTSDSIRSPSKGTSDSIRSPSKGSLESVRSPFKGSLKTIELNKKIHSLSDEDEIIPASQNLRSSLQFDLSSGKLDKSNSKNSLTLNEKKSTDSENSSVIGSSSHSEDSCSSDSEKTSTPSLEKTETIKHNETCLSKFLRKAIDVTSFANKKSGKALCLNKITEEEDLFLIQCPEEIDPRSFQNKDIILNGNSSIVLSNDREEPYDYDYSAIKDNFERFVNLVIPNEDLTRFCLGKVCIAGSVLLTESVAVPKLDKPPPSPVKKVQYPGKLERLCSSLPAPDAPSVHSVTLPFSNDSYEKIRHQNKGVDSHHVKKKKRKRESSEGAISDLGNLSPKKVKETLEDSSTMSPTYSHKKKKRRKDYEYSEGNNEDLNYGNISIKIEPEEEEALEPEPVKKKKKKSKTKDYEYSEGNNEDLNYGNISIKIEPEEEEAPEPEPVKKKKKKSKTKDSLDEHYSEETLLKIKQDLEEINQELDVPVTKKKKKKRKSSDE